MDFQARQARSLSPELGYIYDFTGVEPASAFFLTKEKYTAGNKPIQSTKL